MTKLRNKIRALMAQKDISAVKIEKTTGLNRNTVYSIIAGNSKTPSAQNLQLIAKALGLKKVYETYQNVLHIVSHD